MLLTDVPWLRPASAYLNGDIKAIFSPLQKIQTKGKGKNLLFVMFSCVCGTRDGSMDPDLCRLHLTRQQPQTSLLHRLEEF